MVSPPIVKVDFDNRSQEGYVATVSKYLIIDFPPQAIVVAHDKSGARYYGRVAGYREGTFYIDLDHPVRIDTAPEEEEVQASELLEEVCDMIGAENVFVLNEPRDIEDIAKLFIGKNEEDA